MICIGSAAETDIDVSVLDLPAEGLSYGWRRHMLAPDFGLLAASPVSPLALPRSPPRRNLPLRAPRRLARRDRSQAVGLRGLIHSLLIDLVVLDQSDERGHDPWIELGSRAAA